MFHAFSYVLECWKLCVVRFGLGWTHDTFFCTSHILAFFMHTYPLLFYCWYFVVIFFFVSLPLSLSLSWIDYTWHPSANPLRLGTFFVPVHLLLILPPLMFGSVIGRPIRTSWRTSPNMVFIWNAAWFYRTFPILLYPLSFIVKYGNLCVRYLWDVPPLSWRSYTPICMVSIPLYLSLLHRFEVHIS